MENSKEFELTPYRIITTFIIGLMVGYVMQPVFILLFLVVAPLMFRILRKDNIRQRFYIQMNIAYLVMGTLLPFLTKMDSLKEIPKVSAIALLLASLISAAIILHDNIKVTLQLRKCRKNNKSEQT